MLDRGFRWLTQHQRAVTVSVLLLVGSYFVLNGLVLVISNA
jgi:hypothetical protein